MKRWSVRVNGCHVTSVYADTKEKAQKEAEYQLNREGRRSIYREWVASGREVREIQY